MADFQQVIEIDDEEQRSANLLYLFWQMIQNNKKHLNKAGGLKSIRSKVFFKALLQNSQFSIPNRGSYSYIVGGIGVVGSNLRPVLINSYEGDDYDYQDTIATLAISLLEKEKPAQLSDALLKAKAEQVQQSLDLFLKDKNSEEQNKLIKGLIDGPKTLTEIQTALQTHGAINKELVPFYLALFSKEPLVSDTPSDYITLSPSAVEFQASQISLLNSRLDSRQKLINSQTPQEVKDLIDSLPQIDPEITARHQAKFRKATQQAGGDELAFLREFVTNAYEALRRTETDDDSAPQLDITTFLDQGGDFVLRLADQGIGMDLETIFTQFINPSSSGWDSELLHFGQGFFSVFKGAQELRVRTTRDGQTYLVKLSPMFNKHGDVIDLTVDMEPQTQAEASSGTQIEVVFDTASPSMFASRLWAELRHYVGLFDPELLVINFNNQQINQGAPKLAAVRQGEEKLHLYHTKGSQVFNLNHVYMSLAPHHISQYWPSVIHDALKESGWTLDLVSSEVEELEGRTDFVGREDKLEELKPQLMKVGVEAVAKLFAQQEVSFEALPNDWIKNIERYRPKDEDAFIEEDARKLTAFMQAEADVRSESLNIDWQPYYQGEWAELNTVKLLLAVPSLEIDDQIHSLFDVVSKAKQDEDFLAKLPEELKKQIAGSQLNTAYSQKVGDERIQSLGLEQQIPDTDIQDIRGQEHAQALTAWTQLVEQVLDMADARLQHSHQFYINSDGAVAHTYVGDANISWNLPAIHQELMWLNQFLASKDPELDGWIQYQEGQPIIDSRLQRVLYRIIEITTHEEAHIQRGEAETRGTHHDAFHRHQLTLLNRILTQYERGEEEVLTNFLLKLRQQHQPTDKRHWLPASFIQDKEQFIEAQEPLVEEKAGVEVAQDSSVVSDDEFENSSHSTVTLTAEDIENVSRWGWFQFWELVGYDPHTKVIIETDEGTYQYERADLQSKIEQLEQQLKRARDVDVFEHNLQNSELPKPVRQLAKEIYLTYDPQVQRGRTLYQKLEALVPEFLDLAPGLELTIYLKKFKNIRFLYWILTQAQMQDSKFMKQLALALKNNPRVDLSNARQILQTQDLPSVETWDDLDKLLAILQRGGGQGQLSRVVLLAEEQLFKGYDISQRIRMVVEGKAVFYKKYGNKVPLFLQRQVIALLERERSEKLSQVIDRVKTVNTAQKLSDFLQGFDPYSENGSLLPLQLIFGSKESYNRINELYDFYLDRLQEGLEPLMTRASFDARVQQALSNTQAGRALMQQIQQIVDQEEGRAVAQAETFDDLFDVLNKKKQGEIVFPTEQGTVDVSVAALRQSAQQVLEGSLSVSDTNLPPQVQRKLRELRR